MLLIIIIFINMILGICELYNPMLHGGDNTTMRYRYLINYEITLEEFYNNSYNEIIDIIRREYQRFDFNGIHKNIINNDYENYVNIVHNNKYFNLNLIDEDYLETDELTGTIQTHLLSFVQRKWKKIYKERQRVIRLRKSPKAQFYRKLHGKWPKYCARYI